MNENKVDTIIGSIRSKVQKIVSLYQQYKDENSRLEVEIKMLKARIEDLSFKNETTEKQYKTVKLAQAFSGKTDDAKASKSEIDKLVREIDQCIALLNS